MWCGWFYLFWPFFLTICLKYLPYLPGDVSITRLIQSVLPESKHWAQVLSSTAKTPWVLVLVAFTFVLSWVIAGWRAGLLAIASFVGLWLLGGWLGPVIAQPRPSPELVQVAEATPGSAFPSIFAFNYICDSWISGRSVSGQRVRKAPMGSVSDLHFASCYRRNCQS